MKQFEDDKLVEIVHELRGPIAGLRSFLSLLLDEKLGSLNEKGRGFAKEAMVQADRLNEMVSKFLSDEKPEEDEQ